MSKTAFRLTVTRYAEQLCELANQAALAEFETRTAEMAVALSRLWTDKVDLSGKSVVIASEAFDVDTLVRPLVRQIEEAGADVSISFGWSDRPIRSFEAEEHRAAPDYFVFLTPSFTDLDAATLAGCADEANASQIVVISPIYSEYDVSNLKSDLLQSSDGGFLALLDDLEVVGLSVEDDHDRLDEEEIDSALLGVADDIARSFRDYKDIVMERAGADTVAAYRPELLSSRGPFRSWQQKEGESEAQEGKPLEFLRLFPSLELPALSNKSGHHAPEPTLMARLLGRFGIGPAVRIADQ